MPTYRPPYVGLQYSEALTDAYVHTPADDPVLITLELHHEDWATPVRVVNDWEPLDATLEADAPNDPSTEVEFAGIPFTFYRAAETDSGAPAAITISVDNLSTIITQMIVEVQESEEPIQVYIRTYLRTDTSAPHELPVVKMWVQSPVSITSSSAQLSCSFGDLTNRRFPRLLWRRFQIQVLGQHAYWRVKNSQDGYYGTLEVEFRTTATGATGISATNTGGTPLSGGYYNRAGEDLNPGNAFDGTFSGDRFSSDGIVNSGVCWIGYQFPAPVLITEIALAGSGVGGQDFTGPYLDPGSGELIANCTVDWSDDGVTWTIAKVLTVPTLSASAFVCFSVP